MIFMDSNVLQRIFWGESVFTSMRLIDGEIVFFEDHLERLERSINYLWGDCDYNGSRFRSDLNDFKDNVREGNGYIKAVLFLNSDLEFGRRPNGMVEYLFFKQTNLIDFNNYGPLRIMSSTMRVSKGVPSCLKSGSYLNDLIQLNLLDRKYYDDILFLKDNSIVTEGTTSNIFIKFKDVIKTPPLSSFVLDGIMRKKLLLFFKESKIRVEEIEISYEELKDGEEVLFTNAVKGIRRVSDIDDMKYCKDDLWYKDVIAKLHLHYEL